MNVELDKKIRDEDELKSVVSLVVEELGRRNIRVNIKS